MYAKSTSVGIEPVASSFFYERTGISEPWYPMPGEPEKAFYSTSAGNLLQSINAIEEPFKTWSLSHYDFQNLGVTNLSLTQQIMPGINIVQLNLPEAEGEKFSFFHSGRLIMHSNEKSSNGTKILAVRIPLGIVDHVIFDPQGEIKSIYIDAAGREKNGNGNIITADSSLKDEYISSSKTKVFMFSDKCFSLLQEEIGKVLEGSKIDLENLQLPDFRLDMLAQGGLEELLNFITSWVFSIFFSY